MWVTNSRQPSVSTFVGTYRSGDMLLLLLLLVFLGCPFRLKFYINKMKNDTLRSEEGGQVISLFPHIGAETTNCFFFNIFCYYNQSNLMVSHGGQSGQHQLAKCPQNVTEMRTTQPMAARGLLRDATHYQL